MITVTRAGIEHINDVAVLFNDYRIFYGKPSDVHAGNQFLSERILKNESVIYVAYDGIVMVGFIQMYPIFSSVRLMRTWLLNDLYVAESARGKGIATLLLNTAVKHGAETGAGWLLLQTAADNFTAQSVYNKSGWQKQTDFFYLKDLM